MGDENVERGRRRRRERCDRTSGGDEGMEAGPGETHRDGSGQIEKGVGGIEMTEDVRDWAAPKRQ